MKNVFRYSGFAALLALAACQTMPYEPYAREVKKKGGDSGLIALKTEHREEDMAKARNMMQANCGATPFKIVEEGEVVVGSNTVSNAQETHNAAAPGKKLGSLFGLPIKSMGSEASDNTSSTATTTAVKEWNIAYECEKVVASVEAAPAAPTKMKKKK